MGACTGAAEATHSGPQTALTGLKDRGKPPALQGLNVFTENNLAKADLGTKRVCPSCAARFYDLQKRPIECPKCAYSFEPESLLRQRRTRPVEAVQKPVPVEAEEDAEDTEAEELDDTEAEDEEEVEPEIETVDKAPLDTVAGEEEEGTPDSDNAGISVKEGAEDDDFEEEIEDDDEDDDLLEQVEDDEDDVSDIIDADIEKEEP